MSDNSSLFSMRPRTSLSSRTSRRRYQGVAVSFLVATALTGCDNRFGMPGEHTEQGKDVMGLWYFSLYTATALGVIIFALLFYSMIRHRRKNNELPKQTEGNNALEITYTIIPLLIVIALFLWGLKAQDSAVALSKNPDVVVDVTGYQWNWTFDYPGRNVSVSGGVQAIDDLSTYPEMVLPVNKTTRFNLTAADVNHSFFVPNFLTKRDLIPGVRNAIDVKPNKLGEFVGHCAEFCGTNHAAMNFRVKVVPQAEFDQWVATHKTTDASTPKATQKGQAGA